MSKRWLKFFVGWGFMAVGIVGTVALARLLTISFGSGEVWLLFGCGVACWVVVALLLPRPMLLYVFGHEVTHALWAWAFGGTVKKIKVSARGGYVLLTKSNFLVSLAPYFFPLYGAMVLGIFYGGSIFWPWEKYAPVMHLLLGMAYAFHAHLTFQILQTRQTDITEHGWIFSMGMIWVGNVVMAALVLVVITRVTWADLGTTTMEASSFTSNRIREGIKLLQR